MHWKNNTHNILKITSQYISKGNKHITKKHQQGINQVYLSCSSIKKVHHAHQPSQMHVHVIMHDLPHLPHRTITPQHLCINECSNSHKCSCDSSKHKPYSSIYQFKHVKYVILLTLDLNMWKLDSTRLKHVIKTNQNKQKNKNCLLTPKCRRS